MAFISIANLEEDGLGIGFSAARQTSKSFKNGEKIVFEKVWLNIGSGYNVNTGIFVANKTGLYSFSATIMAMESKKSVSCAFVVNDQIRTRIYGATDFAPGVRTEVMKLSVGDEVYIKMTADGGIYGGLWSSISGHLIK